MEGRGTAVLLPCENQSNKSRHLTRIKQNRSDKERFRLILFSKFLLNDLVFKFCKKAFKVLPAAGAGEWLQL
jgi:hypothetical protein